jgi:hypothetical protein
MAAVDPLTAGLELGRALITRIWPDPEVQATKMIELEEIAQRGDLAELEAHTKLMLAQANIAQTEAQHPSLWVAGGRPAIIWVGAFTLFWSGVIHPMLMWVWAFFNMAGDPPPMIETTAIVGIVTSLLGVGAQRSYDKTQGTHTTRTDG